MKKEIQKELEEIAPFLATLKEQPEGYIVPKHFFNNMRIDIMNKVKTETPAIAIEVPKSSWWTRPYAQIQSLLQPKMAIGFATLLVALVGVFYFLKPDNSVQNTIDIVNFKPQKEIQNTENQPFVKNEIPDIKKQPELVTTKESSKQTISETKNQESIAHVEPTLLLRLEDANEEELNALFDELLENEDISEEELSEEIK